jgi:hypothetical protein
MEDRTKMELSCRADHGEFIGKSALQYGNTGRDPCMKVWYFRRCSHFFHDILITASAFIRGTTLLIRYHSITFVSQTGPESFSCQAKSYDQQIDLHIWGPHLGNLQFKFLVSSSEFRAFYWAVCLINWILKQIEHRHRIRLMSVSAPRWDHDAANDCHYQVTFSHTIFYEMGIAGKRDFV